MATPTPQGFVIAGAASAALPRMFSRPVQFTGMPSIYTVWAALGGGPLQYGRGRAFWRRGDGWNVSVNESKGVWRDFVTGEGGGILDLVCIARDCDRREAYGWLAATFHLPTREITLDDRKRWAAAWRLAERLTAWRDAQREELRRRHYIHFRLCGRARNCVLRLGLDSPMGAFWADVCDVAELRWQELEAAIDRLDALSPAQLQAAFDRGAFV